MKRPDTDQSELPAAEAWVVGLVTVLFSLAWFWTTRHGDGWLEADAASHYLGSRFALVEPFRLVDVWQRPLKTILYSVPAHFFGRAGIQAVSLLLALWCGIAAWLMARRLGVRRPWIAYILCLGMPLLFLHACSELTELPFAALMGLAAILHLRGRGLLAAVAIAILPLGRPEGFGVLALMAGCYVWQRAWVRLAILPVGLVAWSVAGWWLSGQPGGLAGTTTWLKDHWPYSAASVYQPGSLLHFIGLLPMLVGPIATPAVVAGMFVLTRRWFAADTSQRVTIAVVAGWPALLLLGHSILYWRGLMASNGELRYLLVAAPFWAACAASGWDWLWNVGRFARLDGGLPQGWCGVTGPVRLAAYALAVPVAVNQFLWGVVPLKNDDDWANAAFAARWYQMNVDHTKYPKVMAGHPGVYISLDRSNAGPGAAEWIDENLRHPPAGVVLLWDDVYGKFNADKRRQGSVEDIRAAGWVEDPYMVFGRPGGAGRDPHVWRVFFSPKPASMAPENR